MALVAVSGCLAAAPTSPESAARDPNAATVVAEIALERGDCRSAAETYAAAAQRGALSVARRASEVALACEHLPAAWESVKRWRALAPDDRDANAVYATVALKLYHIPEARQGIVAVIKAQAESGGDLDADSIRKPLARP
ncbi:MAG TPA: hypothetical protein VGO53_03700, partial [Steroidobacteraceae bacterium]|nr:hypothetical protein [Steroidobacteraceae bacterium]